MNSKPYKKRIQSQITIYFILLVIFIINSVGWFLYFRARHYFDEELGTKLISIALYSTNSIEADLLAYLKPGDEEGAFYRSIQSNLSLLKSNFDVTRIYVVDTLLTTLVDTQPGTAIGSIIPHLQSQLVELDRTQKGTAQFSTLYRGTDGNLYKSAFAPIKAKSGRVIAIACVDASPSFLQVMDKIKSSIIFINSISLIVAILISFFLARSIVNPIQKLARAAHRVSSGNFSQPVKVASDNEIGYLGQVFNAMQQNIKINQEKLQELRKIAETKADTLQSYNDYILHSIGNGVLTINLDGDITVINPEAARILQIKSSESMGQKWDTIIKEQHPFHAILKRLLKQQSQPNIFEERLDFQKSSLFISIQISPLRDAEQVVIGTNFVLTDLTELRKLQDQIKEKERLAYLGELSAAVAHEIRNPLNSIELFVGLLKRHVAPESKQIQNILKIQTEIQSLNAIVTNFLRFARPPQLQYQPFSITELFQKTLLLADKELQEKNISVRMELLDKNIILNGDFSQLKQACLNIVLNAIQAMDVGGKLMLSASLNKGESNQNSIVIEISDTGEGIDDSDLEKIFEPFHSTRSQGTGLGLAIVRNIIQAHHGTIFVKSNRGKGATVIIKLPVEK